MLNLAPDELICRVITLVIAFTFHEFFHAAVADHFGDTTARDAGRLTLNPLVHLDIFGSLLLLVSGLAGPNPPPSTRLYCVSAPVSLCFGSHWPGRSRT